MTAPLRIGEATTVPVALGARAYDIVIGRGLLGELGTRIAALKPGASAAIITDQTVAARHLKTTLELIIFSSHKAYLTSKMHLYSVRESYILISSIAASPSRGPMRAARPRFPLRASSGALPGGRHGRWAKACRC